MCYSYQEQWCAKLFLAKLIDNHAQLEEGREIFAIGTLGHYEEGTIDLESSLAKRTFTREDVQKTMLGICKGVAALHDQNICHRDLKASNIIILPSGEAKIIDFGSAIQEREGPQMRAGGDFMVRPTENLLGRKGFIRTGKKADSYALFRIHYHLLTGKDLFDQIQHIPLAATRRELLDNKHAELRKEESRIGFTKMLKNDPKLEGVDDEQIELMASLGTSNPDTRKLPSEALESSFLKRRQGIGA